MLSIKKKASMECIHRHEIEKPEVHLVEKPPTGMSGVTFINIIKFLLACRTGKSKIS